MDLYKLKKNFESDKIHACALVLSNHHTGYSHFNSVRSLDGWLQENGVCTLAFHRTHEAGSDFACGHRRGATALGCAVLWRTAPFSLSPGTRP